MLVVTNQFCDGIERQRFGESNFPVAVADFNKFGTPAVPNSECVTIVLDESWSVSDEERAVRGITENLIYFLPMCTKMEKTNTLYLPLITSYEYKNTK